MPACKTVDRLGTNKHIVRLISSHIVGQYTEEWCEFADRPNQRREELSTMQNQPELAQTGIGTNLGRLDFEELHRATMESSQIQCEGRCLPCGELPRAATER